MQDLGTLNTIKIPDNWHKQFCRERTRLHLFNSKYSTVVLEVL